VFRLVDGNRPHCSADRPIFRPFPLIRGDGGAEGLAHAPLDGVFNGHLDEGADIEGFHLDRGNLCAETPGQLRHRRVVTLLVSLRRPRSCNQVRGRSVRDQLTLDGLERQHRRALESRGICHVRRDERRLFQTRASPQARRNPATRTLKTEAVMVVAGDARLRRRHAAGHLERVANVPDARATVRGAFIWRVLRA
jgi:hypothetical protein